MAGRAGSRDSPGGGLNQPMGLAWIRLLGKKIEVSPSFLLSFSVGSATVPPLFHVLFFHRKTLLETLLAAVFRAGQEFFHLANWHWPSGFCLVLLQLC